MEDSRKVLCERCRKFVAVSSIRYTIHQDRKKAICAECRAKLNPAKTRMAAAKPNKKRYLCRRCNYKFSHDPAGITNLLCPYCGKADKLEKDLPQPADRLIRDSVDLY